MHTGAQLQQQYWIKNNYYFVKAFTMLRYMDADVGSGIANGGGKNLRTLFTTYDANADSLFVSILVKPLLLSPPPFFALIKIQLCMCVCVYCTAVHVANLSFWGVPVG